MVQKDPCASKITKLVQDHPENSMDGTVDVYIYIYIEIYYMYYVILLCLQGLYDPYHLLPEWGKKHTRWRRILRRKAGRYYSLSLCAFLHVLSIYIWYTHDLLKDNTYIVEMILGMFQSLINLQMFDKKHPCTSSSQRYFWWIFLWKDWTCSMMNQNQCHSSWTMFSHDIWFLQIPKQTRYIALVLATYCSHREGTVRSLWVGARKGPSDARSGSKVLPFTVKIL